MEVFVADQKTKDGSKKDPIKPKLSSGSTGTYRYDPVLGRIVKVSDTIPSVASKLRKSACESSGCAPAGRSPCSSCPIDEGS